MKRFIYIDKEKAKEGVALVYRVSPTKVEDYEKDFKGKAVEFYGEDLPHFITYLPETNTIREATEEEKVARGNRSLSPGEVLIDGEIVTYNTYSQKIVDGKVVDKTRQDYIDEGVLTLESEIDKAKAQSEIEFVAYHKLLNNSNAGIVALSDTEKNELILWRADWLELFENYTDINIPIEESYPVMNARVKFYM